MTPTAATHCVLCGAEAMLAPRIHLREVRPGAVPHDATLGLCEVHGTRLRKGELRFLAVIEAWLTAQGRLNPLNPLDGLRLLPHCLACDAPLPMGDVDATRTLPTGEVLVECSACPMVNLVEQAGGDPVPVLLWQKPLPKRRP